MPVAKKKTVKNKFVGVKGYTDKEFEEQVKRNATKSAEACAKGYLKRMEDESKKVKFDEQGVDNDPGIDVPLHARGGHFTWNFEEKKGSFFDRNADKITWVLTVVNVAILISLVIKNI